MWLWESGLPHRGHLLSVAMDPEHLVGRLPREHWKLLRTSDLYRDMTVAWATYSPQLRDEMYISNFRVDQTTFERILLEVEVCSATVFHWQSMPCTDCN